MLYNIFLFFRRFCSVSCIMFYSMLLIMFFTLNLCSVEIVQQLKLKTLNMTKEKKSYSVKELYNYNVVNDVQFFTFRVKCPNCRAENNSTKTNLYEMAGLHLELTGNNNLYPIIQALHITEVAYNAETKFYRVRGYLKLTNGRKSYVFTFQQSKL